MPDNPPFHAAILESGVANYNFPQGDLSGPWNETVKTLNCSGAVDTLKCMQQVDLKVLMDSIEHSAADFQYTVSFTIDLQSPT